MNFNIYEVLVARLAKEIRPRTINTVMKRLPDLVKQQMYEKATQQVVEDIYQRRIQQTEFAPQVQGAVSSRLDETLRPAILSVLDEVLRDNIATVVDETLRPAVFSVLDEILRDKILAIVDETFRSKMDDQYLTRDNLYLPNSIVAGTGEGEYLVPSNPVARDFFHPEFKAFCEDRLRHPPVDGMHRKTWEFAYIFHRLNKAGVIKPGARGLGFGVGSEKLPAIFASMGAEITATDAPVDLAGWQETGQYAASGDNLFYPDTLTRKDFDRLVHYEGCDMNNISPALKDYDFCWSSCALEHLGSIQHGLDFILNSVENTLKIGGYACHTTELNMSSDDDTLETEGCVLFRKKDLVGLCKKLEERGHWVEPLRIEPGNLPPDYFVDVPPYASNPHLKLLLASYVTTSVGLIVRRGR